jgi:hypothetical protein
MGKLKKDGSIEYRAGYRVAGTIVSDYFQSLWCGNRIGSAYDTEQNKGKPAEWRAGLDCNFLARRLLSGEESKIKLRPEFEARAHTFTSEYDGKEYTTYGIYKKE